MTDHVFYATASTRFHEKMVAAISQADDIIPVDDVRRMADRTAAEYVAELRKSTDALTILAVHPSYLERRPPEGGRSSLADQIFDMVEEDLERSLDVRIEWAAQFPPDFSPEDALETAAAAAIRAFEEAARKMAPSDEEGREALLKPARDALASFGGDRSAHAANALDKAVAVVAQGLRALGRNATADRWYAAREAAMRLGRDGEGKWVMIH